MVVFVLAGFLSRHPHRKLAWASGGLAILLLVFHVAPARAFGIADFQGRIFMDFITLNMSDPMETPYSPVLAKRVSDQASSYFVSQEAEASPRPVIVLIVESLSAYHSRLFSGEYDYTPRLDELAAKSRVYTNFYANSFITQGGLLALVSGEIPVQGVGRFQAYGLDLMKDYMRSSPHLTKMHEAGYYTAFLSTGDLAFSDKKLWLEKIGVKEWEGAEGSFYNGAPRFWFNAAPDAWLYRRALQWIQDYNADEQKKSHPYMLWLETVTSHWPLWHPEGGENTEDGVFHYVDQAARAFVDELEASGYFGKGGVLVITGDHRTAFPVTNQQSRSFGSMAPAAIPLWLISRETLEKPDRCEALLSQVDLATSLYRMASGTAETPWFFGDALACKPAKYVVHVAARESGLLLVRTDKGTDHEIRLNGDKSSISNSRSDPELKKLLDYINWQRISRKHADEIL